MPEIAGTACRTVDDCDADAFEQCGPPGSGGACGGAGGCTLPWTVGEPCPVGDDCPDIDGAPYVCRTGVDPCCGEVSVCVPRCTDTSCADDERCDADGVCQPIACGDAYACADGSRCDAGAAGADAHGCVVIPCDEPDALACPQLFECVDGTCQRSTCDVDGDCSCGNCLGGQCWDRPWACYTDPV